MFLAGENAGNTEDMKTVGHIYCREISIEFRSFNLKILFVKEKRENKKKVIDNNKWIKREG